MRVFHGSPVHPAKIAREGLKPKSKSLDIRKAKDGSSRIVQDDPKFKGKPSVFVTDNKLLAGAVAEVRAGHGKGYVYSGKVRKEHVKGDPKVSPQSLERRSFHPDTVSQNKRGGHTWKLKSGSLPKHISIQQQRTSLHTRRH